MEKNEDPMMGTIQGMSPRAVHPKKKRLTMQVVSRAAHLHIWTKGLTGNAETSYTGWWQTFLWLNIAVLVELLFLDKMQIGEETSNGNDTSEQDTEIGQSSSLKWPAVDFVEHNWE